MASSAENVLARWSRPGRGARIFCAAALLAVWARPAAGVPQGASPAAGVAARRADLPGGRPQDSVRTPRPPSFSHGLHRGVACSSCHSSRLAHGAPRVRAPADCRRCHHSGAAGERCATCHSEASLEQPSGRLQRTFRLAVSGRTVTRSIPFPHARHAAIACAVCHQSVPSRDPGGADCALCHRAHHQPESDCSTCHGAAAPRATHTAAAHPNCAVAQCHGARAPDITGSRRACLLCHTDRGDHMPGMTCSQCHRVTNPETSR